MNEYWYCRLNQYANLNMNLIQFDSYSKALQLPKIEPASEWNVLFVCQWRNIAAGGDSCDGVNFLFFALVAVSNNDKKRNCISSFVIWISFRIVCCFAIISILWLLILWEISIVYIHTHIEWKTLFELKLLARIFMAYYIKNHQNQYSGNNCNGVNLGVKFYYGNNISSLIFMRLHKWIIVLRRNTSSFINWVQYNYYMYLCFVSAYKVNW